MVRRLGATEEELLALENGDRGSFAPREQAALKFAESLTFDSNNVSEELFALVRQHFTEAEIVEIAAVAGLFNYLNRFNNDLQMEPTREPRIAFLQRSQESIRAHGYSWPRRWFPWCGDSDRHMLF